MNNVDKCTQLPGGILSFSISTVIIGFMFDLIIKLTNSVLEQTDMTNGYWS